MYSEANKKEKEFPTVTVNSQQFSSQQASLTKRHQTHTSSKHNLLLLFPCQFQLFNDQLIYLRRLLRRANILNDASCPFRLYQQLFRSLAYTEVLNVTCASTQSWII